VAQTGAPILPLDLEPEAAEEAAVFTGDHAVLRVGELGHPVILGVGVGSIA
jgi:hypothetical protein